MIPVSQNFLNSLNSDAVFKVKPKVIATWADSRHMDNAIAVTSSDIYDEFIKNRASFWLAGDPSNMQDELGGDSVTTVHGTIAGPGYGLVKALAQPSCPMNSSNWITTTPYDMPRNDFVMEVELSLIGATFPWASGNYFVAGFASSISTIAIGLEIISDGTDHYFSYVFQDSGGTTHRITSTISINILTNYHVACGRHKTNAFLVVNDELIMLPFSGEIMVQPQDLSIGRIAATNARIVPNFIFQHFAIYKKTLEPFIFVARYYCTENSGAITSAQSYAGADQLISPHEDETFSWATFSGKTNLGKTITANGEFTPTLPKDANENVKYGWWGRKVSDSSGVLPFPEMALLNWDARPVNRIEVHTGINTGQIKRAELIYCLGEDWISLGDFEFDGYKLIYDFPTTLNLCGIAILIKQLVSAGDISRIYGMAPYYWEDVSSDVISFDANYVKEEYDNTLPIGIASTNNYTLTLDNTSQRYNKHNVSSPIASFVGPEVKFESFLIFENPLYVESQTFGAGTYGTGIYGGTGNPASIQSVGTDGAEIGTELIGGDEGTQITGVISGTEKILAEIPLGKFYCDDVSMNSGDMSAVFNCRCFSKYFQEQQIESLLMNDVNVSEFIKILALYSNVPANKIDSTLPLTKEFYKTNPKHFYTFKENSELMMCFANRDSTGSNFPLASRMKTKNQGTIENTYELENGTEWTFETWVHTGGDDLSHDIFRFDTGNYFFRIYGTKLRISCNGVVYNTGANIDDGFWHHIAVTFDSGKYYVYVDGQVVLTVVQSTPTIRKKTTVFKLGNSFGWYYFADFRFWSKARNYTEIVKNMTNYLSGFEEGLEIMWRLDDAPTLDQQTLFVEGRPNPSFWLGADNGVSDTKFLTYRSPIMCFKDESSRQWLSTNISSTPLSTGIDFSGESPIDSRYQFFSVAVDNDSIFGTNDWETYVGKFSFVGLFKSGASGNNQTIFNGSQKPYGRWNEISDAWDDHVGETYEDISIPGGSAWLYLGDSGKVNFEIQGKMAMESVTSFNDDKWHMVSVGHDLTETFIHVDNVLVASQTHSLISIPYISNIFEFGSRIGNHGFEGNFSCFALYHNEAISNEIVEKLYRSWKTPYLSTFPFLWAQDTSVWDGMLQAALPDLGMFYFDEYDTFNYEPQAIMTSDVNSRMKNPQFNLSDMTNIISGSQNLTLVANSVEVKVYTNVNSQTLQGVWNPEDNEALAVTYLPAGISKYEKRIHYKVLTVSDNQIGTPYFPPEGIIRIEDEFIYYKDMRSGVFLQCERGYFDTTSVAHTVGKGVFQAKEFDVEFSTSPVAMAKYPFITLEKINQAIVHEYWTTSKGAHLLISAQSDDLTPRYLLLTGSDAEEYVFYTSIAGYTLAQDNSKEVVKSKIKENKDAIRKWGVKNIVIDNQFIGSKSLANDIAKLILEQYRNGSNIVNIDAIGLPHLQLSDRINILKFDAMNMTNRQAWIVEKGISYDGGLSQKLVLKEVA